MTNLEKKELEQRVELQIDNLKDILLHNKSNKDKDCIIRVYASRFRKILSDYYALNAIEVPGALENYATNYDYYILTKLTKDSTNSYKIVKIRTVEEKQGKCKECDCGKKTRYINPETSLCYYKEAIQNNYLTRI